MFSYDHRLLDGREAVTFLVRIKEYIEDPRRMLYVFDLLDCFVSGANLFDDIDSLKTGIQLEGVAWLDSCVLESRLVFEGSPHNLKPL